MRRRFIGNDQTRASARQAAEATDMHVPPPRPYHLGNLAGLNDQKSAFLQHNEGGYNNPRIQRARYDTSSFRNRIPNVSSATLTPSIPGKLLDNRMVTPKHASLTKLIKFLK